MVHLIDEDASRVIAEHESIVLEDNIFDHFISACEKAQKPNKKLKSALQFTKEQGVQ